HTDWMDWNRWLTRSGIADMTEAASLTFNTYALSIQAAVDNLGVALGWRHLVDRHLAEGTLIRPLPNSIRTRSGYFLLQHQDRPLSSASQSVRTWLFTEAGAADPGPAGLP